MVDGQDQAIAEVDAGSLITEPRALDADFTDVPLAGGDVRRKCLPGRLGDVVLVAARQRDRCRLSAGGSRKRLTQDRRGEQDQDSGRADGCQHKEPCERGRKKRGRPLLAAVGHPWPASPLARKGNQNPPGVAALLSIR